MANAAAKGKQTEHTAHSAAAAAPDVGGTRERIRRAAIDLYASQGFNGTSMRDLARAVGVEAASLYHYFPSKHDVLLEVFDRVMDDLLGLIRVELAAPGTPAQRLRRVVRAHVLFHVERHKEAFVSHSELRSLDLSSRARIVAKRDRYQRSWVELLRQGVDRGGFRIDDLSLTAATLLVMCSGVADWIQPAGRLNAEQVADLYGTLALRMVGLDDAAPAAAHRGPRRGRPAAARRSHRADPRRCSARRNGHLPRRST